MKKSLKLFSAALLCGMITLLSGCSNGKPYEFPADYVKVEAPTKTTFTHGDLSKGNIGDAGLKSGDIYAVISVENYGDIKVKLYPELAPYAVQNFITLAQNGNYDNRTFHRVIDNFMIQGNGASGQSSDGGSFRNEIHTDLRHFYGALCSASANGDNSDQFYIVNSKEAQSNVAMSYMSYAYSYLSAVTQCQDYLDSDEYKDNPNAIAYYESLRDFYQESYDGTEAMLATFYEEINVKYEKGGVPSLDGGYTVFGQTVEGFDVIDKISKVEVTYNPNGELSYPVKDIVIKTIKIYTMP